MNDDFDEELARLWAQALQGETPEVARARRAREADNYLEHGYYRDPANLAISRVTREQNQKRKQWKRSTGKRS